MPAASRVLILHTEALAELRDSVAFYRHRGGEGLAERFKDHAEAGFHAILANPDRFPPVKEIPGVHRFRMKHFPFALLYVTQPESIWVVAVAHGSRKPGYWTHRVI